MSDVREELKAAGYYDLTPENKRIIHGVAAKLYSEQHKSETDLDSILAELLQKLTPDELKQVDKFIKEMIENRKSD